MCISSMPARVTAADQKDLNPRPLEPGLVLSIETTLEHPRRRFIKLEDTAAVTDRGYEIFGERARGWNRGGQAAVQG